MFGFFIIEYVFIFLSSGVSKIRLVDFDNVTLSSLNRHATATLADVGTAKVKCIAKTLKQIAKWVEVDTRIDIWRKAEGAYLLEGADWVIGLLHQTQGMNSKADILLDAIDNIQTKVDLLKYCHDNKIKVLTSSFLPSSILSLVRLGILLHGGWRKMRPNTYTNFGHILYHL